MLMIILLMILTITAFVSGALQIIYSIIELKDNRKTIDNWLVLIQGIIDILISILIGTVMIFK